MSKETPTKSGIYEEKDIADDHTHKTRSVAYILQDPPVLIIVDRSNPVTIVVTGLDTPGEHYLFTEDWGYTEIRIVPASLKGVRFHAYPVDSYKYVHVLDALRKEEYGEAIKMIQNIKEGIEPAYEDCECCENCDEECGVGEN